VQQAKQGLSKTRSDSRDVAHRLANMEEHASQVCQSSPTCPIRKEPYITPAKRPKHVPPLL